MNEWKLVPVEPTEEMIKAVNTADCHNFELSWAEGYKAMLNAAPAPGVQPVAWQYEKNDGKLYVSAHPPEAIEQWNDNIKCSKPLYTNPPAADVAELVEALQAICGDDIRRVSVELHEKARAALAKWEGK